MKLMKGNEGVFYDNNNVLELWGLQSSYVELAISIAIASTSVVSHWYFLPEVTLMHLCYEEKVV